MHLPPVENRWTTGNLIAAIAGCLTLITVLGGAINQSNAVPTVAKQAADNTTEIATLKAQTVQLQNERAEDRADILSRLDRIETKLDQKVDKTDQARGWTRP